jgi:hypothetical protein
VGKVCPLVVNSQQRTPGSTRSSSLLVRAFEAARATAPRPYLHLEEEVMENIKLCL